VVARPKLLADEHIRELAHPLLVGPADDQRPGAVFEDVFDRDDFTRDLVAAGEDHVQRLVEHDLLPPLERVEIDFGTQRHPHLPAAGQHVDRAVVVATHDDAVRGRRLRELVDLLTKSSDVFARFAQGVRQLLVLGHRLGELSLRLEQALFERADALGRVLQLAPQRQDLLLEELGLLTQVRELGVVCREPSFVLGLLHEGSPPFASDLLRDATSGTIAQRDMPTNPEANPDANFSMRCFTGVRRVNCAHGRPLGRPTQEGTTRP
jgi:hypothetical protein